MLFRIASRNTTPSFCSCRPRSWACLFPSTSDLMVMLTTLIGFLAALSSWNAIQDRVKEYYALFLLLQTALLGVFVSLDFRSDGDAHHAHRVPGGAVLLECYSGSRQGILRPLSAPADRAPGRVCFPRLPI